MLHLRIKEQARFTRPKYLPEELKGLSKPDRRLSMGQMVAAAMCGAIVASFCLTLLHWVVS